MDFSHNNTSHFDTKLRKTKKLHHTYGKKQSKKRPESTTSSSTTTITKVVCLASAVFMGIPVAQGFGSSGQPEFRILRQQMSDLKYQVHDNSEERQSQHRKATGRLLSRTRKHNSEPKHHVVSNIFHTWWTASKSRRAHEQAQAYAQQQEQQLILDNYLESIDRRYKRLHKDHKSKDQNNDTAKNVAWNFLMNAESVDYIEEQRRQMDAIHVLGLAELASERLLQRHNLPLPQSKLKDKSIIDVHSYQDFDPSQSATKPFVNDNAPVHHVKVEEADSLKVLAATTYAVQLLKYMQVAYRNRLLTIFYTARNTIVGSLKSSKKAIGTTVSTAANLIHLNGQGIGKYATNFIYIFAATIMANTLTFLRLMIKA